MEGGASSRTVEGDLSAAAAGTFTVMFHRQGPTVAVSVCNPTRQSRTSVQSNLHTYTHNTGTLTTAQLHIKPNTQTERNTR